jgi:plastocyanin
MKRFANLAAVIGFIAALGMAATACADDDDSEPTATPPAAATAIGEGGATTATLLIQAEDYSFTADESSVPTGATVNVEFTNTGAQTHTLTFYEDEDYSTPVPEGDSGQIEAGDTAQFVFFAPGEADELYYRCENHPTQMQGAIEVE